MTNLDKTFFVVQPEVDQAITTGMPVVALESTVITHGLPYPENLKLAGDVEGVIRETGCIPATIAILDGKICVGLTASMLERLVQAKDTLKVSVRDIAVAIHKGRSGGTTVAGTLSIAQMVGIMVFATGGIGGVHRGAAFDVSADLAQLARSKMVVVCAGAKAILDIPATLEVLETNGVIVAGYGTDEFPAFYSTSSGLPVSVRVNSAIEASNLARTQWQLGLAGAILVAVPPPSEVALRNDEVENAVKISLDEAVVKGIHGQAVTPYLLLRVSELTVGESLNANLALLRKNARVAGEIAVALAGFK
jgi:pseudouridine-5'-phosphate glycosidase